MQKTCINCKINEAHLKCSKCKREYYCGKQCQIQDWKIHKITCLSYNILGVYISECGNVSETTLKNPVNAEEKLNCDDVDIITCNRFEKSGYYLGVYVVAYDDDKFEDNKLASEFMGFNIKGPILIVRDNDKKLIDFTLQDFNNLSQIKEL